MTKCCKNCKWRCRDTCMYCNCNKPTGLSDWCIGFALKEDTSLMGMVQIGYIDGSSEILETIESKRYSSHYIYNKDTEMFVVFTNEDEEKTMMLPREFVKSIRYIEAE